jgi:hypothetical protein
MGAFAVGFGTMLAAPSKALYNAAIRSIKSIDIADAASIRSDRSLRSLDLSRESTLKDSKTTELKTTESKTKESKMKKSKTHPMSVPMEKTQSEQSSMSGSGTTNGSSELHALKRGLGPKGLGKILRTTIEGMHFREAG